MLLQWFEKLVDPYPSKGLNEPLPTKFFPFVWQAATGVKRYLLILILFTAATASFEALFFSQIGHLVDWLTQSKPQDFLVNHRENLIFFKLYSVGKYLFC